MNPKALLLCAVCLAFASRGEEACVHPARGETRPVSLAAVGRAQEEIREKLALLVERAGKLSPREPYESGLPACRRREVRVVRTEVPAPLVGKTIGFGPSGRIPAADIRVATSARSLLEADADALADPALSARLGVRCFPTLVRARSEAGLELVENP